MLKLVWPDVVIVKSEKTLHRLCVVPARRYQFAPLVDEQHTFPGRKASATDLGQGHERLS